MGSSLWVSDSDSLSVGCSGLVVSDSVGVVGSSVSEGSSDGFSDSEDSGFEVEVPGVGSEVSELEFELLSLGSFTLFFPPQAKRIISNTAIRTTATAI